VSCFVITFAACLGKWFISDGLIDFHEKYNTISI
jgi:hypothetical protein